MVAHRFVIFGTRDNKGGKAAGDPAQGEIDTGKQGLGGETGKNGGVLAGDLGGGVFKDGFSLVQGNFPLSVDVGMIEFCSYEAAQGWLKSDEGQHFLKRMPDVIIVATFAGCQANLPH